MDNSGNGVVIALDIESMFFTAMREFEGSYDPRSVLVAITRVIESIASRYGEVARRIGAFSISPAMIAGRAYHEQIEHILELVIEMGYQITIVRQALNAADQAIVLAGESLAAESYVIATNDGQAPFSTFLKNLQVQGREVHWVSFCYVPHSVKVSGVKRSIISGYVTRMLEQAGQNRAATEREDSGEIQFLRPPKVRDSVRIYYEKSGVSFNDVHGTWIRAAINGIHERALQAGEEDGQWKAEFAQILGVVHRAIRDAIDAGTVRVAPNEQQVSDLAQAILAFSNLFEQKPSYYYFPET